MAPWEMSSEERLGVRERAKFILEGEGRFEVREYMGQASLVAQKLKCLPPIQETWVRSLSSILGSGRPPREGNSSPLQYSCLRRIPRTEEPGRLQSTGSQRVGNDWAISLSFFLCPPREMGNLGLWAEDWYDLVYVSWGLFQLPHKG